MPKSKRWVSWVIAACLVLASGDVLLADGTAKASRAKSEKKRAAAKVSAVQNRSQAGKPAMPSGGIVPPDPGPGYDATGKIKEFTNSRGQTVYEVTASQFDVSAPLSEMAAAASAISGPQGETEVENQQLPLWRMVSSNEPDPVVQEAPGSEGSLSSSQFPPAAPTNGFNFAGVGTTGSVPSDCNGTVGNSQFVEVVNTRYQVWNLNYGTKVATSALGPSNINTVWSGFGGPCQTQNAGDAVVLYDKLADRWLISQFTSSLSGGSYFQCVAVSTTASATGTYARWAFAVPSARFGDYPKIGLWTDAYYMSAHAFTSASGGTYVAAIFAAMDRPKMLAGNAAATWQVILDTTEGGQLPADLDGFTPPPVNAPGIFLSNHSTGMFIYRFKVDFTTPANTVKTKQATVPVAAYTDACLSSATVGTCIPQPAVTRLLDSLSGRLMYRAAYRNFVDHESVVVNHTVDPSVTGVPGAVRWYDFRLSGSPNAVCSTYPCIYEQGTVADAANGRSRWMGSIAMDGSENILLGYSTSGKTNGSENHSIRYTGRARTDALGTMTVPEVSIINGTANNGAGNTRWGDYTSMAVDPIDDCTFWYTNQYLTASSSWQTRVISATYPAGSGAGQCSTFTCANATRPTAAPTIGTASATANNQITVTWTGIAPTPGSYAIERAVGACGSEGLYQPLAVVDNATFTYVDNNVIGGYFYSYRVVAAVDTGGKCQALVLSGCASAQATGTCTLKPVFTGAGSGSSNNNSTCGVNVNWTAATSSCPLTPTVSYSIFRGTTPDFVPSVANRIAKCASGPSSFLDTFNLSSGVTYYYVVRAEDNSSGNGGECNGGNEESNSVVVSGTAYGVGTQASPGTWTDAGGDGTAFLQFNVAGAGDTADQAWRFVSTASDAGANHTSGGAYAYRNAGPTAAATYNASVCAEMDSPALTVRSTTTNLLYWERHQLEYHWDGIAIEYQRNGGAWLDVSAPSNSPAVGCAASDTTTNWENFSCTTATPANACGYITTKTAFNGPLGSGTACASWVTSATVTPYAHRCHQITGLTSGDSIKFRWRFSSDSAANFAGFYLDDIAVNSVDLPNTCTPNPCGNQPNGTSCSDGNACTTGDTCLSQVCTGTPTICNDSNPCTDDACNPASGLCVFVADNTNTCTDNDVCTGDACSSGTCVSTPNGACAVSGSVFYYRSNVSPGTEPTTKPVPQVAIDTNGDAIGEGMSDVVGVYSIPNLSGHVTLRPLAKYGSPGIADNNGAISSLDASLIARTVVGNASMSPNQQLAGDVTGNGTLSALDSAEVARYSVELVDHFDVGTATGSDWKFLRCDAYAYPGDPGCGPALYDYNPITGMVSGQNFYAVLYGEVTGNWQPAGAFAAATTRIPLGTSIEEQNAFKADRVAAARFHQSRPTQAVRAAGAPPAELNIHGWSAPLRVGARRQITIDLRHAEGILGLDLALTYDATSISIVSVDAAGIGSGFRVEHADRDGAHRISAYGVLPLSGSGSVMTVTVEALRPVGAQVPLKVTGVANEGAIPVRVGTQKKSASSTSR